MPAEIELLLNGKIKVVVQSYWAGPDNERILKTELRMHQAPDIFPEDIRAVIEEKVKYPDGILMFEFKKDYNLPQRFLTTKTDTFFLQVVDALREAEITVEQIRA